MAHLARLFLSLVPVLRLPFLSLEMARAPTRILFQSTARPDALLPSIPLALRRLDVMRRWIRSSTRALQETYTGNVLLGKQIHPDRCKR